MQSKVKRFNKLQLLSFLGMLLLTMGCSRVAFQSSVPEAAKACKGAECNDIVPTDLTYTWITGSFEQCSAACGGGTQTRTVVCQREDLVTVPDTFCTGEKPAASQQCNLNACAGAFNWNIGDYGACNKTCGGGTQTRNVICQNSSNQTVADAQCPTPKPGTSQACNTQACPPEYTYAWDLGAFGVCSKDCGSGTQTRTVVCRRNDGGQVADSFCSATPKPAASQACNTQACNPDYTYSWLTGAWSTCSKTCGSGIQTRSVTCQRSDGQAVVLSSCSGTAPASQQACNTQACPPTTRPVTTTHTVPHYSNKVDILLIIDDSESMAPDAAKLSSRMGGFIANLEASNLDYQICITGTNVSWYNGSPVYLAGLGTQWIMNRATPNKQSVLNNTISLITRGSAGSTDEQGIKTANLNVNDNARYNCIRAQAALSVILISDEDERSVGGLQHLSPEQYRPLDSLNQPQSLINNVASKFNRSGYVKPLTFNSIIVKPGDYACEASQDGQGTPSFPGRLYKQLSDSTGGYSGSICAADYTANLVYIKDRIQNSLPSLRLDCTPVGTPQITYSPNFSTQATVSGRDLRFNPALPEGTRVTVNYNCPN